MLLAIDSGNTNIKFGIFDGADLRASWRLRTEVGRTSDQYAALLHTLFGNENFQFGDIDGVIVASSVPAAIPDLQRLSRTAFKREAIHVTPLSDLGLDVAYQPPTDVGADRLIDSLSAVHRYGAPCIVVDFGTGTTFNVIAPPAEPGGRPVYLGGAICPGIGLSLDALYARAAKLSSVELVTPDRAIGNTTARALQAGVLFGFAAQVDGLVSRILTELNAPRCPVIATGGHATELIIRETKTITAVEPQLTLQGLQIAYGLLSAK